MSKSGGGRPSAGYRVDGKRVPSVTTITGHFKGGGLIHWAYNRGLDGLELYESRDAAAETGSVVHQWIEDDLLNHPRTEFLVTEKLTKEMMDNAEIGYKAYEQWRGQVELQVLATEVPLTSSEYRYGGTLDAIALVNGEPVLFDWKTSGGTYPDYIAQVAAYRNLVWESMLPESERVKEAYLLRVGKEFGDFHVHYWPETVLDMGMDFFVCLKEAYEMEKTLKKVAS